MECQENKKPKRPTMTQWEGVKGTEEKAREDNQENPVETRKRKGKK